MTGFRLDRKAFVLLAGLAVFSVVIFAPLPSGMNEASQRLLAVVLLMAIWWMGEATSISVTALLPLVLFPTLGIMPSSETAPNYTNHLVFLFLGGFMIALAMEKWNFHRRVALRIIAIIGTDVRRIILGFMVASAFLSMWISNTATTMMMLPVAIAVVRQVASEASLRGRRDSDSARLVEDNLGIVLMLALAYSASIGGVGTLIGTPSNIVFAGFYNSLYPDYGEIQFIDWILIAIPVVILFIPIVWVYLCWFVPSIPLRDIDFGASGAKTIRRELRGLGPMTGPERTVAIIFLLTVLLWLFRNPINVAAVNIPGWSSFFGNPAYLHDATVAMAMGIILLLLPVRAGQCSTIGDPDARTILDWPTVQKKVPWGILLLFGGGFALADGFGTTGLDQWIGSHLAGLTALPTVAMIVIICLAITFLTELTSNTATTTMILPILGAAAVAANYHPLLLMVPATMSASFAFMLPVATPPNAIVYGSGWVSIARMSRAGIWLNFLGAVLVTSAVIALVRNLST
jgi:sodium-dependent dicarboxylate transporter 2/3/5